MEMTMKDYLMQADDYKAKIVALEFEADNLNEFEDLAEEVLYDFAGLVLTAEDEGLDTNELDRLYDRLHDYVQEVIVDWEDEDEDDEDDDDDDDDDDF